MKTQSNTVIRRNKSGVNQKYLSFLHSLKNDLDYNNVVNLNDTIGHYKVNRTWCSFLTENNIIYKDGVFYKWNNKIPVSIKIVNKFRETRNKIYFKSKGKSVSKQTKISFSNETVKKTVSKKPVNESKIIQNSWLSVEEVKIKYNTSESTVRRIIKDLKNNDKSKLKFENFKNGTKKIFIDSNYLNKHFKSIQIISEATEQKVGVIRKFLRWLW